MRARDGARARDRAGSRRDALASPRRACLVSALALLCALAAPPPAIAQYPAAEAYVAKTTVSPTSSDRTFGAAVAADDGRVATLYGHGSVEVIRFASADATSADATVATLELDAEDVSATDLEDVVGASPRVLAMRDGVVVLGAPGRDGGTGGARVWRLDTSDTRSDENTWTAVDPVDLSSSDGVKNYMGVAVATAGGAIVALGAPSDDSGKGAVYVFADGDGDSSFETPPTKILAPTPSEGDRFGSAVEVSHGVGGPGNGWLVVAAPGADDGAGAVFCYSRVDLSDGKSFGYAYVHKLSSASATYDGIVLNSGFGAGLSITGRFLLVTRAAAYGYSGFGVSKGDASVFLLARSSAADFSTDASSADVSAVVTTDEGRWTLDAVLVPEDTPSGEPAETSCGAGSLDGETVSLGVVGRASENGLGGSVSSFRRVADATTGDLKWTFQSRQTSADVTGVSGSVTGFGRAVAIDDGAVVVTSAGALNATDAAEDFHEGAGVVTRFRKTIRPVAAAAVAVAAASAIAAAAASPPPPLPSPPPMPSPPLRRRPRRRRRRTRRRLRRRRRRLRRRRRPCAASPSAAPAPAERGRGRGARAAGSRAVREHVRGHRRVDDQQDARGVRARAGSRGRRERFAEREDHRDEVQRDVFRGSLGRRRGGVVRRDVREHVARRGGVQVRAGGEIAARGCRVRVPEARRTGLGGGRRDGDVSVAAETAD